MSVKISMADPQKEKDDRLRRMNAPTETRIDEDPNFVAVNTLPKKETTETRTTTTTREDDRPLTRKVEDALGVTDADRKRAEAGMTASRDDRPVTEKIGEKLTGMKEKAKDVVTPDRTKTEPARRAADWDMIQNPGGCGPEGETDYGTRPVSELTPPPAVKDKADLAAVRIMDREKMDRERIMTTATMDAAAARTAMASKEKARVEPAAGERTTRQDASIGTEPTRPVVTERPVTGTVVPPGVETTTPLKPYGTIDDSTRKHARDQSVHQDWERFPQINAPEDVGVPTPEGQADRAKAEVDRARTAERRTERKKEVDRGPLQTLKDDAEKAKEAAKEKARDVREDVDRKI